MLQKLLAMLFSLILALTGALPPGAIPGLDGDASEGLPSNLEVVTLDGDGEPLAVNVLWVQVEDQRVEEDRWGVGNLDAVTFKVGAHVRDGVHLRVGDADIPLHPTDELTIRDFQGRFRFSNVGTSDASILLDGTVRRASVDDGPGGSRLTTELEAPDQASGPQGASSPDNGSRDTGYVQITVNGESVSNVGVRPGDHRTLRTGDQPSADDLVSLRTAWVRIDGERVRDYLHGEGTLGELSFQVAPRTDGKLPVVRHDGTAHRLDPGTIVHIKDFIGSYRVYGLENGLMKLGLDGAASNLTLDADQVNLTGQPPELLFLRFAPDAPTTSHTVSFQGAARDPDGRILLYEWDFGDGSKSFKRNPHHRYEDPGVYGVTFTVTDSDLHTRSWSIEVPVGNTPPTAEFRFEPQDPTDLQDVHFTSEAWDGDGAIQERFWDFGDGTTSPRQNPAHRFPDDGTFPVTLHVQDDAGTWDNVTKLVHVRNVPPDVGFSWSPASPKALEPVQFTNESEDPDGHIVRTEWTFEDHGTSTEANPAVVFNRSGTFNVTLEQVDEDGDVSRTSREVHIENLPPEADFAWTPTDPVTAQPVNLQDRSVDRDSDTGIASWSWDLGDGNTSSKQHPTHAYAREGTYTVELTVEDHHGATDTIRRNITVHNAPPTADFTWSPSEPTTQDAVGFADRSTDPDGDIVSWTWSFDDGNTSSKQDPQHVYADDGAYNVTLTVEDAEGHTDTVTRSVRIHNVPPSIMEVTHSPREPTSRDTIRFEMTPSDPDGSVQKRFWVLPNGTTVDGGTIHVELPEGVQELVAVAVDDDGTPGNTTYALQVHPAPPIAGFTWTPLTPTPGEEVQFTDASEPGDAAIRDRKWRLDETQGTYAYDANPTHTYQEPGDYDVWLKVYDENGNTDTVTHTVHVLAPPDLTTNVHPLTPSTGELVYLNATAEPDDPNASITRVTWNLDDGTTLNGTNVTHSYASPGIYNVTVTAEDSHGATTTRTVTLKVQNQAPTASFTWSPGYPAVNTQVDLTSTASDPDGTVGSYRWDLGDGTTATGSTANHTYTTSAAYDVVHTVTDDEGATDTRTRRVPVVNDHDITASVTVIYPDGERVDLTRPDINVSFTVPITGVANSTQTSSRPVTVTSDGWAEATFDGSEWVGGEPIRFRLTSPALQEPLVADLVPAASATEVHKGPLKALFPLKLDLVLEDAGTPATNPLLELLGLSEDQRRRTYHDPTDPINATVTFTSGGRPLAEETVHGRVTYQDVRGPSGPYTNNRVATFTVTTNATGVATFQVPSFLQAQGDPLLYPPGVYSVLTWGSPSSSDRPIVAYGHARFIMEPTALLSTVSSST